MFVIVFVSLSVFVSVSVFEFESVLPSIFTGGVGGVRNGRHAAT